MLSFDHLSRWMPRSIVILISLLPFVSSCQVLDSSKIDNIQAGKGLGAYFLPHTLVRVTIIEDPNDSGQLKILEKPSCRPDILTGPAKTGAAADACNAEPLQTIKVPDPNHMYRLNYLESASSTEDVKVDLTAKGFLDKVTVFAQEESGTIIKSIAQIAFTLVSGVPSTTTVGGQTIALRAGGEESPPKYTFDGFLDPTNTTQIANINGILPVSYEFKSDPVGGEPFAEVPPTSDEQGAPVADDRHPCVEGVCYRPARPYVMQLIRDKNTVVSAYLLLLENNSPILEVPVARSAFVKRETALVFSEGQLTSVQVKKPSELVQLVAWPLDILNAFFELPAKIFQFRFDNTKLQTQLVNQQRDLAKAYTDLLNARKDQLAALAPKESNQTVGGGSPPAVGH